jgi:hypothetical protein
MQIKCDSKQFLDWQVFPGKPGTLRIQ